MDQIKQFLAVVKKQHFWILSGLAVLLGLIVCFVASNKLVEAYQKQKQMITGVDAGLNPLVGGTEHPNREWVQKVQDKTGELRKNVYFSWKELYDDQLKRVFVWPVELGPTFIAAFSQPASKDDRRRMLELCERYQKFVKFEVRRMGAIVDAEWPEEGKAEGRPHPGAHLPVRDSDAAKAAAAEKTYTVNWDYTDQQRLVDDYDWQDPPSPLDVRYAQEELWVMKAICDAIARTNAGANGNEEATVRDINQILIGYNAVDKNPLGEGAKRIEPVHKGAARVATAPAPGAAPDANLTPFEPKRPDRHKGISDDSDSSGRSAVGVGPGGLGIGPGGTPGGPPEAVDPDAGLKNGRYVGPNGRPLLAKDLQNPPVVEYNLMAFRLSLAVDQLKWEKLLLELANSPLPLVVREVRINVATDNNNDAARIGARRPREGDNVSSGMVHNITLEIRGVAYLMNPPNLASLGLTEADVAPPAAAPGPAAPADAGATPAATAPIGAPATTPPASGAPASPTAPPPVGSPPTTGTAAVPSGGPAVPPVSPPASAPPSGGPPAARTK